MYLNFHTHSKTGSKENIEIFNIIVGRDKLDVTEDSSVSFSAGIHPWYTDESAYANQLKELEALAQSASVKVIGECGMDRLKGPDLKVQQQIFEEQIKLAERVNKPLVIHCVKCFSELLEIHKRLKPKVAMALHGFNNKPEVGNQLLKADFYFSIGTAILREGSNAAEFLKDIPSERLFLENDDQEIAIEDVYEAAAAIRKTTVNELKDIIFANWMSLQKES